MRGFWVGGQVSGRQTGARIIRLIVVTVMLLGAIPAGRSAGAQSDEDAGSYLSPTFGYSLAWDPDAWTVEDEREPTGQSTRDFLRLSTNDADREGLVTGIVFIEGTDEDWSDPDDCVRTLAREIDVRPSRDEPIEDPETGDPYAISGPDRSAAAFIRIFEDENGDETEQGAMFECRADPVSDLIVAFTTVSAYTTTYFDNAYPAFAALVDGLTLPGGEADGPGKGDGPAQGGEDGGAGKPGLGDDGTEPAPSDEPAASDDPSPVNDDPTAFAADEFGVALTWDPTVWSFDGEERGEGYAAVRLSSELLTTAFVPYVSGDGSVTTCLNNYVDILNERGAGTAAIVVRPDGQQDITISDDQTQLEAYVAYTDKDVQFQSRILCTSLSPTDVLAVEFTGPGADLREAEATEQIDGLLDGLQITAQ